MKIKIINTYTIISLNTHGCHHWSWSNKTISGSTEDKIPDKDLNTLNEFCNVFAQPPQVPEIDVEILYY